jgi:hypothetical protein
MHRLTVIATTVLATLAVTAVAVALVFEVRVSPGGRGLMLMPDGQALACDKGDGCAVMSQDEFKEAVKNSVGKTVRGMWEELQKKAQAQEDRPRLSS